MEYGELFIVNNHELQIFNKEELNKALVAATNGSKEAREDVITHNIRLVLNEVKKKFDSVEYDKNELVSIGIVGLIKAVDSYDFNKGYFIPYAIRCIDNEILMFLRKLVKIKEVDSIDKAIYVKNTESDLKIKDLLYDDTNIEEDYINKEMKEIINLLIDELSYREQEVIKLHFGFYENRIYKYREIAEIMNISLPLASKIMFQALNKLKRAMKTIDDEKGNIKKKSKII